MKQIEAPRLWTRRSLLVHAKGQIMAKLKALFISTYVTFVFGMSLYAGWRECSRL